MSCSGASGIPLRKKSLNHQFNTLRNAMSNRLNTDRNQADSCGLRVQNSYHEVLTPRFVPQTGRKGAPHSPQGRELRRSWGFWLAVRGLR